MKKAMLFGLLLGIFAAAPVQAVNNHRFGVGANYWVALEDIEVESKKFDDDGVAYLASYQYWPGLLGLAASASASPTATTISPTNLFTPLGPA